MFHSDRENLIRNSHCEFARVSPSLVNRVLARNGFAATWDCNGFHSNRSDAKSPETRSTKQHKAPFGFSFSWPVFVCVLLAYELQLNAFLFRRWPSLLLGYEATELPT